MICASASGAARASVISPRNARRMATPVFTCDSRDGADKVSGALGRATVAQSVPPHPRTGEREPPEPLPERPQQRSMSSAALDPRVTERRNPRTVGIDLASPAEIVDLM